MTQPIQPISDEDRAEMMRCAYVLTHCGEPWPDLVRRLDARLSAAEAELEHYRMSGAENLRRLEVAEARADLLEETCYAVQGERDAAEARAAEAERSALANHDRAERLAAVVRKNAESAVAYAQLVQERDAALAQAQRYRDCLEKIAATPSDLIVPVGVRNLARQALMEPTDEVR